MKRRQCFKTILSGVLAAVMLVTAAPVNSFTVSAAQVETEITEETPVAELDAVQEQTAQPETVQVPDVNDGIEGDGTGSGEGGDSGEQPTQPSEVASPVVEGTSVTFNYDGSSLDAGTKVYVKGSMNSWKLQEMTKADSGIYSTDFNDLKAGKYEYGFQIGEEPSGFITDPKNQLHVNADGTGNSIFVITGLIGYTGADPLTVVKGNDLQLPKQLDAYTAASGTNTEKVDVTYSASGTLPDGITLETDSNDAQQSILKVSADIASTVTSVELTATDNSGNTCTVEVSIQHKVYTEDPNVKSPVVGKGEATFYYFAPTAKKVTIKGSITGSTWPELDMTKDEETGYWSIKLSVNAPSYPVTYEYGFMVDGEFKSDPLNENKNGNNSVVTIEEASELAYVSPEVDGNKVTFRYDAPSATKVSVAGSMTGWGANAVLMDKNETTGLWELTMENMEPGEYKYKFIVGEDGWVADPKNEHQTEDDDKNSLFWIAGLASGDGNPINVIRGGNWKLPAKLALYDAAGAKKDVAVTYDLSPETKEAAWKDKIELKADEQGVTTVTVAGDLPIEVESFTLTAKDAEGNTSTVTVNVPSKLYKYTIYYYDDEHYSEAAGKDSAALWIWTDGVNGILYPFTGTEVLDGKTWLKAEVELTYTDLNIIPRKAENWDWQDETRTYSNKTEAETTTLYMVFDDGTKIYTEKPEVKTREKRYLVVEYERNDGSAEDWYFYTWNNGYTGFYPFEKVDGVWKAEVPVKQNLSSISYCIEKGGDKWLEKDGNDYPELFTAV